MREPSDAHETETVAPGAARSAASLDRLAVGALVGGRYEIRGELGAGGSAVVYRAHDRLIKREIALKVMRRERLTPNALVRLRREAAAARDVVHANLIRVFDLGTADELTFLAMELVEGESLRERLRRGALPVEEAIRIACDTLRALAALHEAGLLHRDVKPGNVLLAEDGTVRLGDLGLVRRWESDETRATESEAVIGTFEYLSPEQALGEELDERSDLFSLGAMLFEMIAGRLAHEGKSSLGTLLANLRQPVPSLRTLHREVPGWLSGVVDRLLEREREARYGSAREALADLEQRRRPTGGWRIGKRRSALLVAVAIGLAGVAVALFIDGGRSRFQAVISDSATSVRGIAKDGRVLWRFEGIRPVENFVLLRSGPHGGKAIAAVLGAYDGLGSGEERNSLYLLDPQTGKETGKLVLPDQSSAFPGFSNRYIREIAVFDVDGDGLDEIIVSSHHVPFWPSFSALCEPQLGRCRTLIIASGHHRPIGSVDVDGDGRAEVLFAGINNRMGWLNGVTAVRVEPWVGETGPLLSAGNASTPDELRGDVNPTRSAWYVLLPPGAGAVRRGFGLSIDGGRRAIRLPTRLGTELVLSLDGFLVSDRSSMPAAERRTERQRAYEALRQVHRLVESGQSAGAIRAATEAVERAGAANDSILLDWSRRQFGRALIADGQIDLAERTLTPVLESSVDPPGVAWEAARELHLRGHLERAVGWYERGLSIDPNGFDGRFAQEFVEGEVFALAEQHLWNEAVATLERWSRSFEAVNQQKSLYETWIRWRRGSLKHNETIGPGASGVDFVIYVSLETRAASAEAPEILLEAVRSALADSTETRPLLLSLEGELLGRSGQLEKAAALVREAWAGAQEESRTNLYTRVHFDLLRERARRWGG